MIILVLGNTNSGKTHYTNLLSDALPDYQVIRIDDYRRKYGNGKMGGEERAWRMLDRDVRDHDNCIVEFSGMGLHSLRLVGVIRERDSLVVVMNVSCEECISRIRPGKFDGVPFPYDIGEEEMICSYDQKMQNGLLKTFWGEYTLVDPGDIGPVLGRIRQLYSDQSGAKS